MSSTHAFHVAIVGGGLCGISLAIALKKRHIPFTIYESRSSFTEIGAGIGLGPNGLQALRLIDRSLGERVYALATRNPPPEEDTWMFLRYGAASGSHQDGETITKILAPGTGVLGLHRQEFLQALATEMGLEHAQFNKKFLTYEQDDQGVLLKFADGSQERASVLVGCDGIHSRIRATMFGGDNSVSVPHFNHDGAYRAVISMDQVVEAIGETGRQSQLMLGPDGYLICYPVNSGAAVNCGFWRRKTQDWTHPAWILPNQGEMFQEDHKDWGPRARSLLRMFDPSPAFWSGHQHTQQPETFTDGRVILIGDGAHSMPPHQGNGASQAAEDAYILAEALACLPKDDRSPSAIRAALRATIDIRQPRFSMAHGFSSNAGPFWYSFYEQHLEGDEREAWVSGLKERLKKLWHVDLAGEAESVKRRFKELLAETEDDGTADDAKRL